MQQIKSLHPKFYHVKKMDESEPSKEALSREQKVLNFKKLKSEGCTELTILEILEVSRATMYRWKRAYEEFGVHGLEPESRRPNNARKPMWTVNDTLRVIQLRKRYPCWGKYKLAVILKREYGRKKLSVSTVGRIVQYGITRNEIKPVSFYSNKSRPKARVFDGHAQRWQSWMQATKPGQYIQVDHMVPRDINGKSYRHFAAVCPVTRICVEEIYDVATSGIAAGFLEKMIKEFPFPIESIQVDGGSEFRGDFEFSCGRKKIPLFVLPPRSPELNGHVERDHLTVKTEFYTFYNGKSDLGTIRVSLKKYTIGYNTYRPHQALDYLTPWQYYKRVLKEAPKYQGARRLPCT